MKLFLKLLFITVISVVFLTTAGKSYAANICWDGGGTGNNWSEDANWAGDVEPGTGDVAVFDNGTCTGTPNKNATIDANIDVSGINIVAYTGTITQSGSNTITLGAGGYTQASSTSTFAGGSGDITFDFSNNGDFTLSNGAFTSTSGILTVADDWTISGGTFNHDSGTVVFRAETSDTGTLTGTATFNNLTFSTHFGTDTYTIASGTIASVSGTLTFTINTGGEICYVNGPGEIHAKGNISLTNIGCEGDVLITVNGTGSQSITGESDSDTDIPSININKPSGTLTLIDTISASDNWTYTQGTVDPGTSTVVFRAETSDTGTLTGSMSFYNLTFSTHSGTDTYTIASGTNLTALGTLTLTRENTETCVVNGPGTITAQGHVVTSSDGCYGDVAITFSGANDQTFTPAGTNFPNGTLTINKTAGTVTLASALTELDSTGQDLVISAGTLDLASYALTVDDVITINGGLKQGSGNVTLTNGSATIGSTGWWVNNSTGDVSIKGGQSITNNGYVRFDGTEAGCGGTDGISLLRSSTGTVSLGGTGRWRLYDITIGTTGIYSASPALTVYSSSITGSQTGITNNGTCPNERTWDGGGANSNYDTTGNWTGDTVPTTTDLAVFDATSTKSATLNVNPNDNGFQLNLGFENGTITQSSTIDVTLDDEGWSQTAGTFTGGDATSDITINNGGDFILSGGTFTTPGGIITAKDDWTISGGTFTASSGTVKFWADVDSTATITGSSTYNNLTIHDEAFGADRTITVASGTTLTANGALTYSNNGGGDTLNGPGSIYAKGNINVVGSGWYFGNIVTTINGTGSQTLDGESDTNTHILSTVIDKSSGTLSITDTIIAANDWTYTQGAISAGSSTILFKARVDNTATITGSHTLANVGLYDDEFGYDRTITVASGTTLTASGNLSFETNSSADTVNGPGTIEVQGNLTTTNQGWSGNLPITFTGTNAQTITDNASTTTDGTWTINKSSNTVTLASNLNLSASGQDLTITQGTLANSSYNLTVNDIFTINGTFTQGTGNVSAKTYSLGGSGAWNNTSTGDVTVGTGGVSNSGTITLGDVNTCGGTDNISITSSSGGQQRSWSGAGTFNIYDTTVQDQGGSASITAYSSNNVSGNGANWTFSTCPAPPVNNVVKIYGGTKVYGGTRVNRD